MSSITKNVDLNHWYWYLPQFSRHISWICCIGLIFAMCSNRTSHQKSSHILGAMIKFSHGNLVETPLKYVFGTGWEYSTDDVQNTSYGSEESFIQKKSAKAPESPLFQIYWSLEPVYTLQKRIFIPLYKLDDILWSPLLFVKNSQLIQADNWCIAVKISHFGT